MKVYKFTNIFRELDRGTVWLRKNIREPYADDPELFFNIAVYRRHNHWPTGAEIGYITDYDGEKYMQLLLARQRRGEQVFTGAHMICGNISDENGYVPKNKVVQVFGLAFPKLWAARREIEPKPGDTLEAAFNRIVTAKMPGLGVFIAYEIVTDLRWTRYLTGAADIMSWANPGPGAQRGICRLLGMPVWNYVGNTGGLTREQLKARPSRDQYIDVMRYLLSISRDNTPEWFPNMEMRDIEHSLCEFDKYMRAVKGEGRPRSKFTPPSKRGVDGQMEMF